MEQQDTTDIELPTQDFSKLQSNCCSSDITPTKGRFQCSKCNKRCSAIKRKR